MWQDCPGKGKAKLNFLFRLVLVCACNSFCSFSQTEDTNFPKKYWGKPDTVSTVLEDTLNNFCYVSTVARAGGHNEWQLSKLSLDNYQYTDACNSDNYINIPAYIKSVFSGDTVFLLSNSGEIAAYSLKSRLRLWTVIVSDPGIPFLGDMVLYKNRLIAGGNFNDSYGTSLTSINTKNGQKGNLDFNFDTLGNFIDWSRVNRLFIHGDVLYIAGTFLKSLDNVSSYLAAWDLKRKNPLAWDPLMSGEVDDLLLVGNTLYVCGNFTTANGLPRRRIAAFDVSGDTATFPVLTGFSINLNNRVREMEYYKGVLFLSGDFTQANLLSRNFIASYDLVAAKINSWAPAFPSWVRLYSIRNRLYVLRHENDFFHVYCLQPAKPVTFSEFKSKACYYDKGVKYSIPPLPYASSYVWSYSGAGVAINGNGAAFVTLDISKNSTSGILSVKGIAYCGEAGDSLSVFITINHLPLANAGVDDTITCFYPSLNLTGVSNTSFAKYTWTGPQQCNTNCPVFTISKNGSYILTVTDTVTGCVQKDTVLVGIDTLRPNVTLPAGPFILNCKADSITLDGSSSTSNSEIRWHRISDSKHYPDPYKAGMIGQYFMVVQNTVNGCKDSSSLIVSQDVKAPNVRLVSHAYFVNKPVDTLTCKKISATLQGVSDSLNTDVRWKDTSGFVLGNPAAVYKPGIYTLEAGNNSNGCKAQLSVSIIKDITPPALVMPAGNYFLTCSDSFLILDAASGTPGTALSWKGPGNFSSPDPATVVNPGNYIVTATRPDNGCIKIDSITVGLKPELKVNISRDTTVCKGSLVTVYAKAVSASGSLMYTWSNGTGGPTLTVNPTSTSVYYVSVSGIGCTGIASVLVTIPPDIADSVSSVQNCDGSYTGTITVFASGGISPYRYSINNGTSWQNSPVFSGIPFGNYTMLIKDSLGCLKSDGVILNGNSNFPKPQFIVSTRNHSGDTLVFVDISNPRPDSVSWMFPPGFTRINKDMFNPMLTFKDTGKFTISMTAYYGKCAIAVSKTIFVASKDTSLANPINKNGIKSISLYPNPNSGQFTAEVELYKKQNFVLQVVDASGYVQWSAQQNLSDKFIQNINITHLKNGTYVFRVIAEYDMGYKSFVISR